MPSLTIDPEPLRLSAGPASKAESSSRGNKKGEQPVVERSQESSEEDTKSESEEPQPSRNRSRKKRELTRIVDGDGDVSMGEGPDRTANAPHIPKAAHKSTLKATVPVGGKKKHLRTSAPSSTPSDSSDTDVPTEPKIPRKKLKTNLKQLSVEEPAKDEKKREAKGKRKEKLVAQPETEAFIAREKAFGGRDEDEEDDDEPPPAYVKWESESCGEGVQ